MYKNQVSVFQRRRLIFITSSSIVFPRIFGPSTMSAMTQRPREKWTTAHFSCLLLYFTQLASYKSQQRGGGYRFWIFLIIFDSYFVPVQYKSSNKLKHLYHKFMKKKSFVYLAYQHPKMVNLIKTKQLKQKD